MPTTTSSADAQLLSVNIKEIIGPTVPSDQLDENLRDLISMTWGNVLDEEVAGELSDTQVDALAELFSNQNLKPEDMAAVLRLAVPDFDERFQRQMLFNKAELIRGRIEELAVELGDESKLTEVRELAEAGEWLAVQDKIKTLNAATP